ARAVAGEAEILTIGVAATARRRGIARALLGAALGEARGRGAETVFLEVAADNDAAIRLYRACLFRPAGRRRDYYGPGRDALLFTRPLS
ncbi:MAG TPA: GNAT family N-acetyltransferase, partial [Acidiphilium sp.]|nr:GNAT family N-acetyltransferase [Acidiphilium sp.]